MITIFDIQFTRIIELIDASLTTMIIVLILRAPAILCSELALTAALGPRCLVDALIALSLCVSCSPGQHPLCYLVTLFILARAHFYI